MPSNTDQVEIRIGQDLIAPIIEAKIQAAIIEALGDERGLIERVVAEAVTRKVPEAEYSSRKVPWIEHVCQTVIRGAAETAIRQWAESQQQRIADEFLRQLQQKTTSRSVVKAMIEGMVDASKSQWKFSVQLPKD